MTNDLNKLFNSLTRNISQQLRTDAPAPRPPAPKPAEEPEVAAPAAGWTGNATQQRPRVSSPGTALPQLNPAGVPPAAPRTTSPARPAPAALTQGTVTQGTVTQGTATPGVVVPGTEPKKGFVALEPLSAMPDKATGGVLPITLPTDPAPAATDAALKNGVPQLPITKNMQGGPVTALQYSLGRLGYMAGKGLADGKFGKNTENAVKQFQKDSGLPESGVLDAPTFKALDAKLAATDLRSPASKAENPLAYLRDFKALGMEPIKFDAPPPAASWSDPRIGDAYGKFVGEYWDKLKENRVEADCKAMSMVFMDAFRDKLKQDTGIALPLPGNAKYSAPQPEWSAQTQDKTRGYFSRFEKLDQIRDGYGPAQQIQQLDPGASMLQGVNLRPGSFDANQIARSTVPVQQWDPSRDNGGDLTKPEIPINEMKPGDLIFIDHGKGKWDHAVNVVKVERGPDGAVTRAVFATGSFDDMKDGDGATAPRGTHEVNNYTEEVTVDFGPDGRIARSRVTWSSEPEYMSPRRYDATKLLMEKKENGRIILSSWGGRPGQKPEAPWPAQRSSVPETPVRDPFVNPA